MRTIITTALDVIGAGLVVTGVALMFGSAAFVVAGAFILLASWRLAK